MGVGRRSGRRRSARVHPPWWLSGWVRYSVLNGEETSYLVGWTKWGTCALYAWVPVGWRMWSVEDFQDELFVTWENGQMKKPIMSVVPGSVYAAPIDDMVDKLPSLAEHLTSTAYDGDPPGSRATSTFLVFAQDGMWKGCLRDRQEQRCLWVSAMTMGDLFLAADAALNDPAAVWRDDRLAGAEQAKRQKPQKRD